MSVKKIMISAGEASGEANAAALVRAMKDLNPDLSFFGMGGPDMARAGVDILVDSSAVNVVGFLEVLPKLASIFAASARLKKAMRTLKPDLLIVVDLPDFNFNLALAAKRLGIPVVYYIPPQVWAWRTGRVKKIAQRTDLAIIVFPFEVDWYAERGVDVFYAGHPMLDRPPLEPDSGAELRRELGIGPERPIAALLPGSRRSEITRLMPVFIEAARRTAGARPDVEFVIPVAPNRKREDLAALTDGFNVHLTDLPARRVLAASRATLICSGTATFEAALADTPMVVAYKGNAISYFIARLIIHGNTDLVALPNLIGMGVTHRHQKGDPVVPVLLQNQVEPEDMSQRLVELIDDSPARRKMKAGLAAVREKLGEPGSAARAAARILEVIDAS